MRIPPKKYTLGATGYRPPRHGVNEVDQNGQGEEFDGISSGGSDAGEHSHDSDSVASSVPEEIG